MTDEEKKAIEILEKFKKYGFYKLQLENDDNRARTTHLIENSIDMVLNLINKQETIIDEMVKYIEYTCYYIDDCGNYCDIIHDACNKYDKNCNECVKEYFYRKVENK